MKKILFVSYGGGHVNIINLIAQQLLNDKNISFKILALTTAYNEVVDKYPKGTVVCLSDYKHLFNDDIKTIDNLGNKYLADNYNPNGVVSKKETMFYIGLSFYDLIQKIGKNEAVNLYKKRKRQSFLPVSVMEKILQYEKVDIVVSTTAPRFEQASLIAGNNLGIQTLEILDLFGEVYPLPEAKNIITMNSEVTLSLKKQGLLDKTYYEFGQPSIEKTVNTIKSLSKNDISKRIRVNTEKKILLIATQKLIKFNDDLSKSKLANNKLIYDELFDMICSLVEKYDLEVILRIHPSEDKLFYKSYLEKYPFIKYINNHLDIYQSIAVCDFLLTHSSTVGIEALSCSRTVFTYKHREDIRYPVPQMTKLPFMFSDGFEELEKNLCKYLDNPTSIDEIDNFMPNDAAKNIAKLIKEL